MFNVNIYVKDEEVLGRFVADSYFFVPSKYYYAFRIIRLHDDGTKEKVIANSYSDNTKAAFDIPSVSGIYYMRCFVRDKEDESTRIFDSEKIII